MKGNRVMLVVFAALSACQSDVVTPPPLVTVPLTELAVVRNGPTNASLLAAWAATPTRAWVGGQAGVILAWDGTSWRSESIAVTETTGASLGGGQGAGFKDQIHNRAIRYIPTMRCSKTRPREARL